MKVRMRTQYAGPSGTCGPGKIIDLPQKEARELIKGKYAEAVNAPQPARQPVEESEQKDS